MQYQASGRASSRRRWPLVVPPLLALALVAAGLAGRAGEQAPADEATNPEAARAPIVRWIECGGVANAECGAAVAAARRALDDPIPTVHTATVSPSLICGDDLDCPRWFLHGSRSVGSVVLTFADSPLEAWVNVVEPDPEPAQSGLVEQPPGQFLGRVIRWFERS
jgi:hypothetical protein